MGKFCEMSSHQFNVRKTVKLPKKEMYHAFGYVQQGGNFVEFVPSEIQ